MISFYRIGAVIFRHLMTMKRVSWFVEISYWTILDIIIFGLVGKATTMVLASNAETLVTQALISNVVLWYLVLRSAITIGFSLLNELYDANLITLFATPLRKIEWIISCVIVGSLAAFFNLILGIVMAHVVFNCNILAIGTSLIPIVILLLLSGWVLGLVLMGVLLFVGKKGTGLAFVICWSVVPFSCVYYPIEVFPVLLQKIVWFIPMAHVFNFIRTAITTGVYSWLSLVTSFGLNIVYLVLATGFFAFMFKRSKKRGLARLELEW